MITKRVSRSSKKKRITALLLSVALAAAGVVVPSGEVQAADKVMTLSTCRSLALENSSAYESAEDKVSLAEAKMQSAIKSLKLKKENLTTFRWSPLLSFHFPEKLNEAQASEFEFKPQQLASDLEVAQHNMQDKVFEVNEKTNNLYVEIVTLQESIKFNESRLQTLEDGRARNQAKLKLGEANQADIDKMDKKIKTLTDKVASDRRTLEADLQKLSKMIKLDVTTGYTFEKPYVEAKIDRDSLPALITYTEDRDQTYYEACAAATVARTELRTNYNLMRNYYGGDMNAVSSYVNQALNDQDVSTRAFKKVYKDFLKKIDSYWEGKYKIHLLFFTISFPKLWLKGDLDGTRYIEDDPNILQENVINYVGAHKDELAAADQLAQSVTETFNSYISVRNSYQTYLQDVAKQEQDLKAYAVKNRLGEMTYEEYSAAQDDYEELQNNMLSSMSLYTTTLNSFDRQTCGGISALLSGTDADMHTAVVGESYVDKSSSQIHYYLKPIIQREMFALSLFVPEGFPREITHFELWCDKEQIGERTPVDKELRHLTLTKENVQKVMIRLYDGETFIDDCEIDPIDEQGVLNVTTALDVKKKESGEIGTYLTEVSDITGFTSLTLKPDESEGIASFRIISKDGAPLGDGSQTKIDKKFTHLGLVASDLVNLEIEFYGADGSLKYKGRFDTSNNKLKKKETE